MEITNIAYVAGLFDGEGYVDIYSASTSKASKSISLMLRVVISQKDGAIMNWLENNFGGHVRMEKRKENWIYRWDIRSQAAKQFLQLILPFLKIKTEQVKMAIEFEEVKGKYLETLKGHQGFRKLTKNEIGKRLEIKNRLKNAKHTYSFYMKTIHISAPTTTKRKDSKEMQ
jgi:hypothetical protein